MWVYHFLDPNSIRYSDISMSHKSTPPICLLYWWIISGQGTETTFFSLLLHLWIPSSSSSPTNVDSACTIALSIHRIKVALVLISTPSSPLTHNLLFLNLFLISLLFLHLLNDYYVLCQLPRFLDSLVRWTNRKLKTNCPCKVHVQNCFEYVQLIPALLHQFYQIAGKCQYSLVFQDKY